MDSKLPPGIRPGTREWGAAAHDIRRTTLAARIRRSAKIPPDAQPIALVAAALGISRETIRTRISKGLIPGYHVRSRLYVRPIDAAQRPPRSAAKAESDLRNLNRAWTVQRQGQTKPDGKLVSELTVPESFDDAPSRAQDAAGRAEEASEDVQVLPGEAIA